MITDFATYKQYFKTIADTNIALAGSFYIGDSERIVAPQKSKIKYPVLWLEFPVILPTQGELKKLRGAFVILKNCTATSIIDQDAALQYCLEVAEQVVSKMKYDTRALEEEYFDIEGIQMDPVTWAQTDNNWGWRVEFSLDINIEICYDESKWTPES